MTKRAPVLLLLTLLLLSLTVAALSSPSALAEQPLGVAAAEEARSAPVTVSAGEGFYSYEGMTVYNNGGTVYNTLGTVYNNGGIVYSNGGTVYNNGGSVYADSGRVFNNSGTVYNHEAEVLSFAENAADSRVLGYYELKLADYYEPYVLLEGVTVQPGSEMMIISEDSVCRITPRDGFRILKAKASAGTVTYHREDGSVLLTGVDADMTLTLTIRPQT